MPAPQPTTIEVVQDGAGLEGATVTLTPADASHQWEAGGTTDASGTATPFVQGRYKGVVPGRYKVVVAKRETVGGGTPTPDPEKDPDGYARAMANASRQKPPETFDLVDPKFGSATTTEQEIDVVKGTNRFTVEVGKAVRIKVGN